MLKMWIFLFSIVPLTVWAAGYPGGPTIYALESDNKGQVIMMGVGQLEIGKNFAGYEGIAPAERFFHKGQKVWVWCANISYPNRISDIRTKKRAEMGLQTITDIDLEKNMPLCSLRKSEEFHESFLSNYPIPKQRWHTGKPAIEETKIISQKFELPDNPKIIVILSEKQGKFFLVHDPKINAIYATGGYRLLDKNYAEISVQEGIVSPIIDLDNDTMPEFFLPSTDGLDAWVIKMFPAKENITSLE